MRTILSQCWDALLFSPHYTAVWHDVVVYVLLLRSPPEKKFLLGRIKSKLYGLTSKPSPEFLVFQTVNCTMGVWGFGDGYNENNWRKLDEHVSSYRLSLNPKLALSARWGGSSGEVSTPAAVSSPSPSPSRPSFSAFSHFQRVSLLWNTASEPHLQAKETSQTDTQWSMVHSELQWLQLTPSFCF